MNEEEVNKIIDVYDEVIADLMQEKQQLKEEIEKQFKSMSAIIRHNSDLYLEESNKLIKERQQLKHILDELEKWLEEEINTIKTTFSQVNGNYFIMNDRIEVLEDTLDKIRELRGRENE